MALSHTLALLGNQGVHLALGLPELLLVLGAVKPRRVDEATLAALGISPLVLPSWLLSVCDVLLPLPGEIVLVVVVRLVVGIV